ncbi:MAG TPA: NAD-dependent epimerase/dehydratase family protein [Polyangiaceae bacterium]|nr:NAD-dependent epimerase/dehydratase family protein [Polyangiaceae bacterium]
MEISVFGASGFVGSRFCALHPGEAHAVARDAVSPAHDQILYLVSTTHNYHVYDDLQIDIDTNLKHLMRVLEHCRERDFTLNFVSSWFVYGTHVELPAKESAICNPRGFYAITKKCAEDLLVSFCRTFGKKYRILRLSGVYGPGDRFSKRKNALQYMIQRLVRNEPVELYAAGTPVRDYLYVDDVARALRLCMDRAPLGEITNVGSGVPARLGDLIHYCRDRLGSKSAITSVEPPEFHRSVQAHDFWLDVSRLESLGFEPRVGLHEGLDRVMDALVAAENTAAAPR